MSPDRRQRIEDLFEAALEQPPEHRAAFLAEACRSDGGLRTEVEALLAAHERVSGPLERSVTPLAASLLGEPFLERRIGPYRLLRELGRGGMGVVYLADRDDGQFRRRVAIKLVNSGLDDGQIVRRFLAERQILASLNHPNVAQLLDGGLADAQLPYLVMEYVEGLPITAYCDRHQLGIAARLRLFHEVCAAVHHAHQNLVLHRDLKPSNIVVDSSGKVKLLDFGIAKLLNPSLAPSDAPFTRLERWVMTPEYASPEQVRGESLSTASDVYALGVILYELLTGHRPYQLTTRSPDQILELVCRRDPERPSTRVVRTETPTAESGAAERITPAHVSAARGVSIERLARQLRGDLDAIVMMALRKEPNRRYGSAEMLSQDLQRYLDGRPVMAHSGSHAYLVRKFLRRHRIQAAAGALVALSLLAGAGAASWQARVAGRERDRAAVALAQANEVTNFMMELFQTGDGDAAGTGEEVTARDLLRRGTLRAAELAAQPAVQARMLDVLGRMYHRLGQYDESQRLLERALAIRRAIPGDTSLELSESLIHLAWVHRSRNEHGAAHRLVTEALEIRRQRLPPDHPDLAEAVYELGWLSELPVQERLYREALAILQRTNTAAERQVQMLQALSTNLRRQGHLAEAVEADREALRLAEREFGPDHYQTGHAMIHLGDHVRDIQRDAAEAERLYLRGLELLSRQFGENHVRLIHGLNSLADLNSQRGDHLAAEMLFRRVLDIHLAATGPDHPGVAAQTIGIAREMQWQGRLEEAEATAREGIEKLRRVLGSHHPSVSIGMTRLASILSARGQHGDADRLFEQAIELNTTGPGAHLIRAAEMRRAYGQMLLARADHAQAEEQLLESLKMLGQAYDGFDHPNVIETKRALMELYRALNNPGLVERYRVPPGEFVKH
jgi:eukaryotic-like serine/threonine-protein kinase